MWSMGYVKLMSAAMKHTGLLIGAVVKHTDVQHR